MNLQADNSLRITVVCNTLPCTPLLHNYQGITPTLAASSTPIYVPIDALGFVSDNPLKITDYFHGVWTIMNGTNGANGVNGVNGVNGRDGIDGKDCSSQMNWIWILLGILICVIIWDIVLTVFVFYKKSTPV